MKSRQLSSKVDFDEFHKRLYNKLHAGFRIIEQNNKLPYVVLLKEKRRINHSLHFFLCCITVGFWLIVWGYVIIKDSKESEILIAIDEDGNVFEEKCQAR